MADSNIEETQATTSNGGTEYVDNQGPPESNDAQNSNTANETEPKNEPKNNIENEDKVDKSKKSAKILLIVVNICTLICSIVLFVVGVMMTVKHAKIHEEWNAGYGFMNASIICIVISLVLAGVGSMGKFLTLHCTIKLIK